MLTVANQLISLFPTRGTLTCVPVKSPVTVLLIVSDGLFIPFSVLTHAVSVTLSRATVSSMPQRRGWAPVEAANVQVAWKLSYPSLIRRPHICIHIHTYLFIHVLYMRWRRRAVINVWRKKGDRSDGDVILVSHVQSDGTPSYRWMLWSRWPQWNWVVSWWEMEDQQHQGGTILQRKKPQIYTETHISKDLWEQVFHLWHVVKVS